MPRSNHVCKFILFSSFPKLLPLILSKEGQKYKCYRFIRHSKKSQNNFTIQSKRYILKDVRYFLGGMKMKSEKYNKGMEKLKDLTVPTKESKTGHMDIGEGFKDIAPDLEDFVVEFAFGDIYDRPGLSDQQKVLATISALVGQGLPQIGMHVETGLVVGLKPEEIVACILHLIPYAGFPKVLNALKVAQGVFEDKGIKVETIK